MFFKRRQDSQITLHAPGIVIANKIFNHLNEFLLAGETSAIITFTLQNTPKPFHRPVVNAVRHTGHALHHARFFKLMVKSSVGVLVTSVTVKQGMCLRVFLNSPIKRLENKRIVVAVTDYKSHDAPVIKV